MAQHIASVDGMSDLSVQIADSVYDLDFFPKADSPLVDTMLDVFPPVLLMQELKSDTFRKAFTEIYEKVTWLHGYTCRTRHVNEVKNLKYNSDEAIDHLKLLYSAFRSSGSDLDRLFNIDATSEIVLENANIIYVTTCDLLTQVEEGNMRVEQLKEFVSKEMNEWGRHDESVPTQDSDAVDGCKKRALLQSLKAFVAKVKRHFNYLIDSAVENNKENAQLNEPESDGFHTKHRRMNKCDVLNREIAELNGEIKALQNFEEQANQEDNDTQETALVNLHMGLEIMELHLVYAFFFLTQLEKYALVLHATCRNFRSIALGDTKISEKCWTDFKYEIFVSNARWVAIDRLFIEYAKNEAAN